MFENVGNYAAAARTYRRILRIGPASSELYFKLGYSSYKARRISLAIRYLRRGRRLDKALRLDFDFWLAVCYLCLNRYDAARRASKRALRTKRHPATLAILGKVYQHLGKPKSARACFEESLTLESVGSSADDVRARLKQLDLSRRQRPA
jgi:tetratricopeptide (TPR) repeat protein